MALTSPITVTINAVDKVCKKINQDGYGSHYRYSSSTERLDLKIRHVADKPKNGVTYDRHNVELTWTLISADPDVSDTVVQAYIVLKNESTDLGTNVPYLAVALADLIKVSGNVAALVGWEN